MPPTNPGGSSPSACSRPTFAKSTRAWTSRPTSPASRPPAPTSDFYCIGPFHAQEDRLGLDDIRDIFQFHAAHERFLAPSIPVADVAIAVDHARNTDELRGLIRTIPELGAFDIVLFQ